MSPTAVLLRAIYLSEQSYLTNLWYGFGFKPLTNNLIQLWSLLNWYGWWLNFQLVVNQPYDETLEVNDEEDVASTFSPSPRPAGGKTSGQYNPGMSWLHGGIDIFWYVLQQIFIGNLSFDSCADFFLFCLSLYDQKYVRTFWDTIINESKWENLTLRSRRDFIFKVITNNSQGEVIYTVMCFNILTLFQRKFLHCHFL